ANIRDLTESFTPLLDRIREKASSKVSPAPASILLLAALATFASAAASSSNFILMFTSAPLLLLPHSVLLFPTLPQSQGRQYNDRIHLFRYIHLYIRHFCRYPQLRPHLLPLNQSNLESQTPLTLLCNTRTLSLQSRNMNYAIRSCCRRNLRGVLSHRLF